MNISVNGKRTRKLRRAPSIYYSPNSRGPKQRKPINWPLFWTVFKLVLPLIIIIYVIYFSPAFKLKEILVSGNDFLSSDQIAAFVPKGANIFSLNTVKTEERIKSSLPEIYQIKLYKGIPNALKIVVVEHKGSLIWQSGTSYYLISGNGTVFRDVSNNLSDYTELPRIVDQKDLPVAVSQRLVSMNFIQFIQQLWKNVKTETNLDPDYFAISETTVDVILFTKNAIYIKFDSLRNPEKQMQDLKLTLMEKKPEILEYVDLRVNGWAYYK